MGQATHNKIVSFIWGIANDEQRDLFKRGKYPDVILPMCVLRRMDAVLEPTMQAVLDTKKMLDEVHITEQRAAKADALASLINKFLDPDIDLSPAGMLTVAKETLTGIGKKRGLQPEARLDDQEINPETYAICKANMLIKGEGENADHIVGGAEWSTLSCNAVPSQEFHFMVANPPYGKSKAEGLLDGLLVARAES